MRKASRIILWTIIGLLFVGTFVYLFLNSREKPVSYELVSPSTGNISRTTVLTGKIEPRDEIEIKPQISGIIAEINVEAGDMVHAGDVIARIKVIPEESQLSSAQSRVSTAKISLDQARMEYERTRSLYERKFVAREEYEKSETEYKKATQELESAEDALRIVREGVSSYNAKESNTLVRATIDGQVLEVPVKVGTSVIQANTMNDGTTVAKIADMRNLIFKGKADETEVGLIKVGMATAIAIGALPEVSPTAVIEYIAPKSTEDNGSNTFEIKAALEMPDSVNLRAGYSANATITLARADSVMTVPESVIEWGGDSAFVYRLTDTVPEYKFERIPVGTGLSDGINIQIKDGVTATDRLRGNEISDK
ncbi:efflux RND transporter periplasmic adaptor subunit [uncultured Muribaculum sp.]|uniref:efflux RND transporter periplasmic adaptor subunit n=1 Tax=uncultured Muribaculum sp. TaxID=1918613 RepID=UPI0025ED4D30|nr:efflux RND transporter periplasmic adaptor subunit [uncultured Muribaculum sp.]